MTAPFSQEATTHNTQGQLKDDPRAWLLRVLLLFILGHQYRRTLVLLTQISCTAFCLWIALNQTVAFREQKLVSVMRSRVVQGARIAELQSWLECLIPAAFLIYCMRKLPKWLNKLAITSASCCTGPLIIHHVRQGQRFLGVRIDPLASVICLLILLLAVYHFRTPLFSLLVLTARSYQHQLLGLIRSLIRRKPRMRRKVPLKPKPLSSTSTAEPQIQHQRVPISKSARGEPSRSASKHASWTTKVDYTVLERDEIRLLRLLPSAKGETGRVRCELEHVSLVNTNEPYVALSYCWGEETEENFITLGGKSVPVTRNLQQALFQLRRQGYGLLWIDALCINQTNWEERSAQVLRMSSIYKKAKEVVVWLGTDADGSEKIMAFLRSIPPDHSLSIPATTLMHLADGKPTLHEFGAFLRRPYWRRVWIVQEVAAATRVRILCGKISTPWDSMRRVVKNLVDTLAETQDKAPTGLADIVDELMLIHDLAVIRTDRLDVRPLSLLQALIKTKSSSSTISHDKVFGLLGLVYDREHFVSVPDYTLSDEAMCKAMTKSYVMSTGILDILFAGTGRARSSSLPSWCPDYLHVADEPLDERLVTYLSGVSMYRAGRERRRWNTTGESRATPYQSIQFFNNNLVLRGWHVGTISGLGGTLSDDAFAEDKVRHGSEPTAHTFSAYNALCRMLLIYDRKYSKLTDAPILLGMLYNPGYQLFSSYAGGDGEIVRKWLDLNRNFVVHGRKLCDRARYSIFRVTGNYVSGLLHSKAKTMTVFDYKHISKSIASIVGEGLRLMTTREGGIGWAHPRALLGDEIFLFAGCSMPVILRQRGSKSGYHVVGHAYVDSIMDNELWSTMDEARLVDVEIW